MWLSSANEQLVLIQYLFYFPKFNMKEYTRLQFELQKFGEHSGFANL